MSQIDKNKAVLLLSGGLDSAVTLAHLLDRGFEVAAIAFNYGQRHKKELRAAEILTKSKDVPLTVVDLSGIKSACFKGSSQTDAAVEVPEGHYEDETMKATVVPNRNMIMISVALAHAISIGAGKVVLAAHAGDHAIYPDCRPEFVAAMEQAASLCHYEDLDVWAPFVQQTKAQIVAEGARLKVPFDLTWSCYKGGDVHCGKCGTCVERKEAFQLADVFDTTIYEG